MEEGAEGEEKGRSGWRRRSRRPTTQEAVVNSDSNVNYGSSEMLLLIQQNGVLPASSFASTCDRLCVTPR